MFWDEPEEDIAVLDYSYFMWQQPHCRGAKESSYYQSL